MKLASLLRSRAGGVTARFPRRPTAPSERLGIYFSHPAVAQRMETVAALQRNPSAKHRDLIWSALCRLCWSQNIETRASFRS